MFRIYFFLLTLLCSQIIYATTGKDGELMADEYMRETIAACVHKFHTDREMKSLIEEHRKEFERRQEKECDGPAQDTKRLKEKMTRFLTPSEKGTAPKERTVSDQYWDQCWGPLVKDQTPEAQRIEILERNLGILREMLDGLNDVEQAIKKRQAELRREIDELFYAHSFSFLSRARTEALTDFDVTAFLKESESKRRLAVGAAAPPDAAAEGDFFIVLHGSRNRNREISLRLFPKDQNALMRVNRQHREEAITDLAVSLSIVVNLVERGYREEQRRRAAFEAAAPAATTPTTQDP
jgi:hypothetical protein